MIEHQGLMTWTEKEVLHFGYIMGKLNLPCRFISSDLSYISLDSDRATITIAYEMSGKNYLVLNRAFAKVEKFEFSDEGIEKIRQRFIKENQ